VPLARTRDPVHARRRASGFAPAKFVALMDMDITMPANLHTIE